MEIISVNVSLPREVVRNGTAIRTAIFKEPVDGAVAVSRLNLAGDRQADLSVHGGPEKAVYAYPSEHYGYWRNALPGVALSWGNFGENLTTRGLLEDTVCIGDRVKIGSAVLAVTQPRLPCYKLDLRFDRDDMIDRFLKSERTGFYFSVLEEGEIRAGAEIELLERESQRIAVVDLLRLYLGETQDRELLERALNANGLSQKWKARLSLRAEQGA